MNQYERMQSSSEAKLLTTGQVGKVLTKTNWHNRNTKTVGKREVIYQRGHVLHWAGGLTFVITRVCLSNLANPLFCVFFFILCYSAISCFHFWFCVCVLSFAFLFWVLWFCFGFCDSVLSFVILFWVLGFCFRVLWFYFDFCDLFCSYRPR